VYDAVIKIDNRIKAIYLEDAVKDLAVLSTESVKDQLQSFRNGIP